MVFAVLEAIKGFPEREVPDHIECRVVIPFGDINHPFSGAVDLLVQFANEQVDVRLNTRFLFSQCSIRERVRKYTALPPMV